ncbi:MAG: hypothetical protein JEZ06_18675 [Anaerolineaceae bacterium]|nr:hypothetical protein [Anaerolineaceae bacterium]
MNFQKLKQLNMPVWVMPILLFIICLFSFGLPIPDLGFFQDDWNSLYYSYSFGVEGISTFFFYDNRPLSAILFNFLYSILKYNPQNWHVFLLIARWATSVVLWLSFKMIWPNHSRQINTTALIFVVYPYFKLQALSVTYAQHWSGYLSFAISLLAMIYAIKKPGWQRIPLIFFSLIPAVFHMITNESYVGLEIARIFIIWFVLNEELTIKKKLSRTFTYGLPYMLSLIGFVIWRIWFMQTPGFDRNYPTVLFDLVKSPFATSLSLLQKVIQDLTAILVSPWFETFNAEIFAFEQSINKWAILITIFTFILLFVFYYFSKQKDSDWKADNKWNYEALFIGLIIALCGLLPGWLVGRQVFYDRLWDSRFGMASTFGTALILVALLEILIKAKNHRMVLFCLLISLSVGWSLRIENDYRWAWAKQQRFYQQLYWRAPYVEPNTTFLSHGELFSYMGVYPTAFGINTLYPQVSEDPTDISYWFFTIEKYYGKDIENFRNGMDVEYTKYASTFHGRSKESLVIFYEPEGSRCLWVLEPEDKIHPELPDITLEVIGLSDIERIKSNSPLQREPLQDIFKMDIDSGWCYYFQKGDLASQNSEWEKVTGLWNTALDKELRPRNGFEFIPFIEGFAYTGEWETANQLTLRANQLTAMLHPLLCQTWDEIEANTETTQERDENIKEIRDFLSCP